ncbi:MAG: CooT family nickel-binding protein [Desulfomonile sp.]|nr:CooT family nickel-binding protein [Desulfomonile sp.]
MCESAAYIVRKDGKEELVMESVGVLKTDGGTVVLRSIFGEEMRVEANLREMNLVGHRIVLEERPS